MKMKKDFSIMNTKTEINKPKQKDKNKIKIKNNTYINFILLEYFFLCQCLFLDEIFFFIKNIQ